MVPTKSASLFEFVRKTDSEILSPDCIDLFASTLNAKLEVYCAWKPDPEAKFIDAFMLD